MLRSREALRVAQVAGLMLACSGRQTTDTAANAGAGAAGQSGSQASVGGASGASAGSSGAAGGQSSAGAAGMAGTGAASGGLGGSSGSSDGGAAGAGASGASGSGASGASSAGQAGTSGTGGVAGDAGEAGAGAAGAAGAADDRWLDPGPGVGCGVAGASVCGALASWSCSSAPSNPDCSAVSGAYCCPATCVRDWVDDDAFCPGAPILVVCVESAGTPPRCTPYGTSTTVKCCDP